MSKEKNKIVEDIVNYLKFYQNHYNYTIYKKDIKERDSALSTFQNTEDNQILDKTISKEKSKERVIVGAVLKEPSRQEVTLTRESWMECNNLETFALEIQGCPKCKVLVRTRTQVVFGTGNPKANLVVVGEAPGADEDLKGEPFVGRAGKLLTDILIAINLSREEVYICNILKCRPPENRNPLPDEIVNCEPYLFKQLDMIKPKLILAVGTFAAQTLLKSKEPLGKLRGRFHQYNGIKTMVTYHPAALLRNPNWKRPTWEDVQLLRREYDNLING